MPNPEFGTPVRLVREGIIDIEVNPGGNEGFGVEEVHKIPDSSKKLTFIRAKYYDKKGKVAIFKPEFGGEEKDYYEVMVTNGGTSHEFYNAQDTLDEVEFFIYFVDINKIPTPVPQKTIKI
jgi:hypothetical protein